MARSRGTSSVAQRRRTSKRSGFTPHLPISRRLIGTLLLLLTVLTAVSLLMGDGGIARGWNYLLHIAFGWGCYLLPLLTGVFGLALLWSTIQTDYQPRRREAAGWLLLFSFFLTLFQLLMNDPPPTGDYAFAGGFFGQVIAHLLVSGMGPGGAYGIVAILGLAGAILASGLGPGELWGMLLLSFVVVVMIAKRAAMLFAQAMAAGRDVGHGLQARREPKPAPHFRINRPEREEAVPPDTMPPGRVKLPRVGRSTSQKAEKGATLEKLPLPPVALAGHAKGAARPWQLPPISLLDPSGEGEPSEADIRQKVQTIEDTLRDFGIKARVVEVNPGPVVTQFGLDPGFRERRDRNGNVIRRDKVKVSEITALRDDLALALAARTVRIEAPVPGRAVIGLEIPNSTATLVRMRKVIETASFQKVRTKSKLAIALGQDVSGGAVAADLTKMPHVLIAGATGSGKSVCMNAIITCFLLNLTPDELRMVMIDPKRVELTSFREVPHLLRSVVVDAEQAVTVLKWVMHEMETRLKRFEAQGVRNIESYNRLMTSRDGKEAMPYLAVLIDELADLMMTAPEEVERSICRLAQLARATGIHLVIATQRPSVDVVTGLIKANFPTRISFAVASQVDSRTILDTAGAEQLLGSGDMLYLPADAGKPKRLQGVFLSDEEVNRVVTFWKNQGPPRYVQDLEEAPAWSDVQDAQPDPMYDRAVEIARQHTRISASLLQRRLGVGYNRAARLMDILEEHGVVAGAEGGGKPREVLPLPGEEGAELVEQ